MSFNAEYEDLNHQLDQINSCLDLLEQQNDALKAELQNFLLSSRQARNEGKVDQSDEMVDSSSCSDDDTKCS